jgi:hypothetical protein
VYEQVARHRLHGGQDPLVFDATPAQLTLDHEPARLDKFVRLLAPARIILRSLHERGNLK